MMVISRPASEQFPRYGQRLLLLLRSLALLLLLFGMLRPTIIQTTSQRLSAVVNILLDQTQSMSRNDEIGGKTRFAAAKDALQQASTQLQRLQQQTAVNAFGFDYALTPLELQNGMFTDLPDTPKGTETALGFVLDDIRERCAGKRVLATILLTDGAQRTRPSRDVLPQNAAARLRDAGNPLYAISFGQGGLASNIRDIAVHTVQSNDRVFVKNNLLVTSTLRFSGFANQMIPVQLLFETATGKEEVVANTTIQAGEDGQEVKCTFSYAPQTVGLFKYTVRVPPQEREITDRNNEMSDFVQVVEGGLHVLYIQGQRNFEQRPLRAALGASPDINVQSVRVDKQGSLAQAFRNSPVPYDVFILDDINASLFTKDELQTLVNQIKAGAGFIMLGGWNAFAAGGYAETPLAEVSPVVLHRADQQPENAPIRQDIHWSETQPIPMTLTEQGARHYVMRFDADPQVNARRWSSLPPLLGANRFDRLKPGAVPLATGPNRQQVLLAAQMSGLGRVLAFAGDSTYRWALAGFEEEHQTFWRQVVLWLAKMEGGGSGTCWVTVENNRLFPGDTAKFQIFLRDEMGDEVRNFPAKATVLKSDNTTESVALVREGGIPTGSFRSTDFSGDYLIQVEAVHEGETKEATARFLVQGRNLELDNPVTYPKLLSDISSVTGGRSIPSEQLGKLLNDLIKQSNELVDKRETKQTLFDTWFLLLGFIVLLSAEWSLRKYWGLA